MKHKILIIDDEIHCRNIIKKLLLQTDMETCSIKEADSVSTALEKIREWNPEVLFLDIQMGDGTGFDLLKQIEYADKQIIFTTAFNEFALRAFDFNAIHYLLKPISKSDLNEALKRINTKTAFIDRTKIENIKWIEIKSLSGISRIMISEIQFFKSHGAYTEIFMTDGSKKMTSKNIGEYEKLVADQFFRVHKSYLINLNEVVEIIHSKFLALTRFGIEVPVSRRKRKEFVQAWEART